jgi:Right handed beta helix region
MSGLQSLKFSSLALTALLLCVFSDPRLAEAAIIKITQSKAQNGAVTPGDAPGFPVTISQSGSYVLDSNLTVPANKNGIEITASNVTINLMGFTIQGSGGNTGKGIYGNVVDNISVTNGFITGMGDEGILLTASNNIRIERMTVHGNASTGVYHIGSTATIIKSSFSNNSIGVHVGKNSLIADNTISENGFEGLETLGGTIARNTIAENGDRGIVLWDNNVLVIGNTIERNGGIGIQLGGPNQGGGYRDNVINNNLGGTVIGGKNMGGNLCNQSTSCP